MAESKVFDFSKYMTPPIEDYDSDMALLVCPYCKRKLYTRINRKLIYQNVKCRVCKRKFEVEMG